MPDLLHHQLTEKIIRAYFNVYNGLSRTYPEFIYENAMIQELQRSRIPCVRQEEYSIFYKEWLVGKQRLDIFVAAEVVVEIKVKPQLTPLDQAQTISYLKTTDRQIGLLFNFGSTKPEFHRLFFTKRSAQPPSSAPEQAWPDLLFPEISYQILGGLFEVHNELGPGFIHRIYANACYQEIQARGLAVAPHREITVFYRGKPVGKVKLGHLQIENSLGILANFYTDHLSPELMRVTSHQTPSGGK